MKRFWFVGLALAGLILSGCASKAVPTKYPVTETEVFPAINLYIDAGHYISHNTASVMEYMERSVQGSGLFSAVEVFNPSWPLTLHLEYDWQQPMDPAQFAGLMVSAATLLVIPAPMSETHSISARLFLGDKVFFTKKYSKTATVHMSLYSDPIEERKKLVQSMIDELLNDLQQNKTLPRLSDFEKTEPEKNTEKLL